MNKKLNKLFSATLVLMMVLSQSSSLIATLYASSEFLSEANDVASSEVVSEQLLTETTESEVQEEVVSEDTQVEEESTNVLTNLLSTSNKDTKSIVKSTNGATTVEIEGYDEISGMDTSNIYNVNVTVNFGDDIVSEGKELIFTLPDGMQFMQIPVKAGSYNTSGIDNGILGTVSSDDPVYTAIQSIEVPTKEAVTHSTFGTVKYSLTPGTKGLKLTFKVKMDNAKILESHTLKDQMIAITNQGGEEIGKVGQNLKVTREPLIPYLKNYTSAQSYEVLINTSEESFVGQTLANVVNRDPYVAMKNLKVYMYYPQGANYVSLSSISSNVVVTNDPANSRIIITDRNEYSLNFLYTTSNLVYTFPEGTTEGIHQAPQRNYFEFETYNGERYSIESTLDPLKVNAVSSKTNKANVSSFNMAEDHAINSNSLFGGLFLITNPKGYALENQVIEYEIGENFNANSIAFPYSVQENNGDKVQKMMYKTHQDDVWVEATQAQLNEITYNTGIQASPVGVLEVKDLNLESTKTISGLKVWIGNIPLGYTSPRIGTNHYKNASNGVFGKLKDANKDEQIIIMNIYDETNKLETLTTGKSSVRNSENDTTFFASSLSSIQYVDADKKPISNVIAGDRATVKGYGNIAPIIMDNNIMSIKAPVMYVVETPEYTIDKASFTFKDNQGNNIPFKVEEKTRADGIKIYSVITDETYEIGTFFNSETNLFEANNLNFEFDIVTNLRASSTIMNNNVVSFGSSKYDINAKYHTGWGLSSITLDIYDMDGDGSTTDYLLGSNESNLLIKENTNVLVDTYFSLAGSDEKIKYVPGDDNTAAHLTVNDLTEYTAVIFNNSGADVPKFDAYIPVPKTGSSFGGFFQDEAFTWDMSLSNTPPAIDGFKYYYSTDATQDNFTTTATYVENPTNLDDVVMIKAVMTNPLKDDEEKTVKFQFKVNETFKSTIEGEKAGSLNVFKIFYDQITATYSGVLNGTPAAVTYRLDPEVTVPMIETFVGEDATLMGSEVVALDYYNENFKLIEGENTTIESSGVPIADGKYTTPGTYEATYTVHDAYGGSASVKRLIKVHGPIVVDGTDQTYWVTNPDIAGEVAKIGSASYLKAGDTVGSEPVSTNLDTTYEVTRGETDFSEVGTYDVVYSATDEFGRVANKQVLVTVLGVGETNIVKSVEDTDNSGTVSLGETLNYTITVSNDSEYVALDVLVRDSMLESMPAWATFNDDLVISNENYTGSITEGTLHYDQVQVGEVITITYSFTINEFPTDILGVKNTVTTDGTDPEVVDPEECVESTECTETVSPFEGDTTVVKAVADEDGSNTVSVGETLSYKVIVSNDSPYAATNVTVRDSLLENMPSFVTFNNDVKISGGDYTGDITLGTLNFAKVAAGDVIEITYSLTLNEFPTDGSTLGNVATTDGTDPETVDPEECEKDDECTGTITPFEGDADVAKFVEDEDGSGTASIGETLSYTLTVTNSSPYVANNVVVRDSMLENIPAWATYNNDLTISNDTYSGDVTDGTLVFNTIAAGDVITITYSLTMNEYPKDGSKVENTATTDGEDPSKVIPEECVDNERCTNTSTDFEGIATMIKEVADEDKSGTVSVGEKLSYTLKVTNETDYTANKVNVRDSLIEVLPSWVKYNEDLVITSENVSGDIFDGSLVVDSIEAGKTVNITYSLTVLEFPTNINEINNVATSDGQDPNAIDKEACDADVECAKASVPFTDEEVVLSVTGNKAVAIIISSILVLIALLFAKRQVKEQL